MMITRFPFIAVLLLSIPVYAQSATSSTEAGTYPLRKLTVEPAIGINPYPTSDLLLSVLVQWNSSKRIGVVSCSSYAFNNAIQRTSGPIKNDYNRTVGQKLGIGASAHGKRVVHSLSLLAGAKYDAFQETWVDPDGGNVTASVASVCPDIGLLYNVKVGRKKYYFSYRTYIPLYPYPLKTLDPWSMDANLANISLEFGVGIRLDRPGYKPFPE